MSKSLVPFVVLALILCMGSGVLAQGAVSLGYWWPEVTGANNVLGFVTSDEYWGEMVGDPLTMEYPDTNGLELKAEVQVSDVPVGIGYWSLKSDADFAFTADEDQCISSRLNWPEWTYEPFEGPAWLTGTGELEAKILDVYVGQDLLATEPGVSFFAGVRKADVKLSEKSTMFEEWGYYEEPTLGEGSTYGYGYGIKDESTSEMTGPFAGVKGKGTLVSDRLSLAGSIKVGVLNNNLKVSQYQYDFDDEDIEENLDWVYVDTAVEDNSLVLNTDVELKASYAVSDVWEIEAGYRAVNFARAAGRIMWTDSNCCTYGNSIVDKTDIGFSGFRVGALFRF